MTPSWALRVLTIAFGVIVITRALRGDGLHVLTFAMMCVCFSAALIVDDDARRERKRVENVERDVTNE